MGVVTFPLGIPDPDTVLVLEALQGLMVSEGNGNWAPCCLFSHHLVSVHAPILDPSGDHNQGQSREPLPQLPGQPVTHQLNITQQ